MLAAALLLTTIASYAATFDRRASDEELLAEKRGRVVDSETGAGLASVQVIGTWDSAWQSFNSSGFDCLLQKVVATDVNGYYVLPNVSHEITVANRRQSSIWSALLHGDYSSVDYGWRVVLFKPGYFRDGDAERLKSADHLPNGYKVGFRWQGGFNTPATLEHGIVHVEPIAMHREDIDPIQQITYFDRMRAALTCAPTVRQPSEVIEIEHDMARLVRALPCAMPPNQLIGGETASQFAMLLGEKQVWMRLAANGEPTLGKWREITAESLCSATREGAP